MGRVGLFFLPITEFILHLLILLFLTKSKYEFLKVEIASVIFNGALFLQIAGQNRTSDQAVKSFSLVYWTANMPFLDPYRL